MNFGNKEMILKLMLLDAQEFVMVEKQVMMKIDKLKHFHVENYSGTNFTDDLNDSEEFLYTTIRIKDDKEVTLLCKYVKNKHIGNCPNCIFNNYLCYGLLCNIVVLKVVKDKEMRHNK